MSYGERMGNTPVPEPPHPLGALTTSELATYEDDLRSVLKSVVLGNAVRTLVYQRLDSIADEWVSRQIIQETAGKKFWPIHNGS